MKKPEYKYYRVVAKCGHVGRKHYVPISFAVVARNGKEASKQARDYARVKHHHKDAILSCTEVSYDLYKEIKNNNDNDPYLHCKNKKEQKAIEFFDQRIEEEPIKDHSYIKSNHKDRYIYKYKKYKEQMSSKKYKGGAYYANCQDALALIAQGHIPAFNEMICFHGKTPPFWHSPGTAR